MSDNKNAYNEIYGGGTRIIDAVDLDARSVVGLGIW